MIKASEQAKYLVLLQPLLQKLLPALLQDGAGELERLKVVEFTLLKQDTEVLEDR